MLGGSVDRCWAEVELIVGAAEDLRGDTRHTLLNDRLKALLPEAAQKSEMSFWKVRSRSGRTTSMSCTRKLRGGRTGDGRKWSPPHPKGPRYSSELLGKYPKSSGPGDARALEYGYRNGYRNWVDFEGRFLPIGLLR